MAGKIRTRTAVEGVNLNQGSWIDTGETFVFATFTSTSTATIYPFMIIQQPTSAFASIDAGAPIMRLQGGQLAITGATAMAAQTTLDCGLVVYHSFATLATQITNAGGALTSLNVTALNAAMPSGQTFTLTNAAGTVQTWTLSAAAVRGATTLAVNSQTPTGTNAVGNQIIGLNGNGILFGWLHPTGTPAFPVYGSVIMPAQNTNILAGGGNTVGDPVGPYVYLFPGDILALYTTSAGSVTVQAGLVSFSLA